MKIASADVQLQSSHVSFTRREVSERIEMWIGERNPPAGRGNGGSGAQPVVVSSSYKHDYSPRRR